MEFQKTDTIAIIGLGYVGLPFALLCTEKGFNVIGIDVDQKKIQLLKAHSSYLTDVSDSDIKQAFDSKRLHVTNDYSVLKRATCIIICVPTPLEERVPNLDFVTQAAKEISNYLQKEQLIILESSTYPGTTEELLLPILEQSQLKEGLDFYLAYSPERIDPGQTELQLKHITKLIGGVSEVSGIKAKKIYDEIFNNVYLTSSSKVAEMAKLLENTYRFVNISLINELAILCDQLGIDIWEVIDAAKTKPYGFQVFYPGPGIGGHCIPVDPLYLNWKLEQHGLASQFITLSDQLNQSIITYNVESIHSKLTKYSNKKHPTLFVYGVTYKANVNDIRESPAIEMIEKWLELGVNIIYHDPYINSINVKDQLLFSMEITPDLLNEVDAAVILTDHDQLPAQVLLNNCSMIFDTRNALNGKTGKANVFKLGNYFPNI